MNTCVIIEDEPLAAERLVSYIGRLPQLQLLKWFDNGKDAVTYLSEHKVDLLFLDLHLGETSGIELIEKKQLTGKIIITTAYNQYALKGYEWDVADYLMKPFVFDRFEAAVNKALRKQIGEELFIMIRSEYKQEKVFLKDIYFIEGMGDYRRLHTNRGKIMTLQTFKELESMLSESTIQRVHKSYMINADYIAQRTSEYVILTNGERIPISDSYKGNLK